VGGAPSLSGDILIRSAVDGEVSPMMDMLGADILIVAWPTQSTVSGRPSFPLLPRHWAAAAAVISAAGPARIRQGRCLPQLGAGVCVCVSCVCVRLCVLHHAWPNLFSGTSRPVAAPPSPERCQAFQGRHTRRQM